MDRPAVRLFVAALFAMAPFASAVAQDAPDVDPPLTFDGPPPPVPPEVISRDASGRTTVRAVRLTTPLRLDGRLDEELYQTVPSMSGFIQGEPQAGAPATQQTEVWMFFDDEDVYFGLRCWEAHMDRVGCQRHAPRRQQRSAERLRQPHESTRSTIGAMVSGSPLRHSAAWRTARSSTSATT